MASESTEICVGSGEAAHKVRGYINETAFLKQLLSIAIQRRNAISIRGTLGALDDA